MAVKYRYNFIRKLTDQIIQMMVVHDFAPKHYYLLTVKGRKTGMLHSKPVALVEDNEQKWLVAPYGEVNWVLNARAAQQVSISRGKNAETYSIQELPVEERPPVLKRYITLFPITRPYFDAKYTDPAEAFIPEAHWRPVFKLCKKVESQ